MIRELVLIGTREPSFAEWRAAIDHATEDCLILELLGGEHAVIDRGVHVISWWPARPVNVSREVEGLLGAKWRDGDVWIDVAVPGAAPAVGDEILRRLGAATEIRVWEEN